MQTPASNVISVYNHPSNKSEELHRIELSMHACVHVM